MKLGLNKNTLGSKSFINQYARMYPYIIVGTRSNLWMRGASIIIGERGEGGLSYIFMPLNLKLLSRDFENPNTWNSIYPLEIQIHTTI